MRKILDSPAVRGNGGGKVAGGIAAKKAARTNGTRPTVPPGGIKPMPVNAATTIGKRLSKLARR